MRSLPVVMVNPLFGQYPYLGQFFKEEGSQDILSVCAVKSLYKTVLNRFSRLDIYDIDSIN